MDIRLGLLKRSPGLSLRKRTKFILLWAYLLKGKNVPDNEREPRFFEEVKDVSLDVKWKDFYILNKWFYKRIKDCSYKKDFTPVQNETVARTRLKLTLRERSKYYREIKAFFWQYMSMQNLLLFNPEERSKWIRNLAEWMPDTRPIICINFRQDNIKIERLKKSDPWNNNTKVIFPDNETFIDIDYSSLFSPRHINDKVLNDFFEELLKK